MPEQAKPDQADILSANETLTAANVKLTADLKAANDLLLEQTAANESLTSANETLAEANTRLTTENAALLQQRDALQAENADLKVKLVDLNAAVAIEITKRGFKHTEADAKPLTATERCRAIKAGKLTT